MKNLCRKISLIAIIVLVLNLTQIDLQASYSFNSPGSDLRSDYSINSNQTSFTLPEKLSEQWFPINISQNNQSVSVTISGINSIFDASVSYVIYTERSEKSAQIGSVGVSNFASNAINKKDTMSFFIPTSGTYWIRINNSCYYNPYYYSGTNKNTLFFSYELFSGDSYELNNSLLAATPVVKDQLMKFTLNGNKEEDWFKIEVTNTQIPIFITLECDKNRFDSSVCYWIYNSDMVTIGSVAGAYASNAINYPNTKTFKAPNTGIYYIRIANASGINPLYYSGDNLTPLYLKCNFGFSGAILKDPQAFDVVLSNTSVNLAKGGSLFITAKSGLGSAKSTSFSWEIADSKIAAIDVRTGPKVKLTGIKDGNTTLKVTTNSGSSVVCRVTVKTTKVKKISLNTKYAVVPFGKKYTLKPTIVPSNATNKKIIWKSKDTLVALVDKNGVVTGRKNNASTVINAISQDGNIKASCVIYVGIPVAKVKVSKNIDVFTNKTIKLSAKIEPNSATMKKLVWTSQNPKIASVNSVTGVVKGVSTGKAIIECKTQDGSNIVSRCTVSVKRPVSKITLNKKSISIMRNEKTTINADVKPQNATNRSVEWKSDNTKIATVNKNTGEITGKTSGKTKIYCFAKDGSKVKSQCQITVTSKTYVNVSSVTVTPSSLDLLVGAKAKLSAAVMPFKATNKNIEWKSSNTNIATVNNKTGEVTAISGGNCEIAAISESGGKVGKCKLNVTNPISIRLKNVFDEWNISPVNSYQGATGCAAFVRFVFIRVYNHTDYLTNNSQVDKKYNYSALTPNDLRDFIKQNGKVGDAVRVTQNSNEDNTHIAIIKDFDDTTISVYHSWLNNENKNKASSEILTYERFLNKYAHASGEYTILLIHSFNNN